VRHRPALRQAHRLWSMSGYSGGSQFIAATLPSPAKQPRQIFVAYSYRLYDKRDYRRAYNEVGKAFDVQFVFADEKITDLHILQKIMSFRLECQRDT
jgi:hypothetical protein